MANLELSLEKNIGATLVLRRNLSGVLDPYDVNAQGALFLQDPQMIPTIF